MYKAEFKKHELRFIRPAGTSRGILNNKPSWIIRIQNPETRISGFGECSIIPGLSIDDPLLIESKIASICNEINKKGIDNIKYPDKFPAIEFGFTTALLDLKSGGNGILYQSDFTSGMDTININGLIWMGSHNFMLEQIKEKVKAGFSCIKLKIGAINFNEELDILKFIRKEFSHKDLELRVDANGAFSPDEALLKIDALSAYDIHSIEQPIKAGQYEEMADICLKSSIAVALDEELIGISDVAEKEMVITSIKPQYIILKPGLLGGFSRSEEWIKLADQYNIGWWVTSALEGSIGLNAISQWTYSLVNQMPQGLGTGSLFTNNLDSQLSISNGSLKFNSNHPVNWDKFFDVE